MSVKAIIKSQLTLAVAALPFPLQRMMRRPGVFLPYYHLVSDEPVAHCEHCCRYPATVGFERDLDFFLQRFTPVSLREFVAGVRDGAALPANAFLLSFDDGYRELHDVVGPILKRKGVPAAFFLNPASLDNKTLLFDNTVSLLLEHLRQNGRLTPERRSEVQSLAFHDSLRLRALCAAENLDVDAYLARVQPYLTGDQVTTLIADGFEIGAHSIDHPPYRSLSIDEQVSQTLGSLDALAARFPLSSSAFAFPGTDAGVGNEFFQRVAARVDVSFGTSSGMADPLPRNFQRISFDYSADPAAVVLAERSAMEMLRRLSGRNVVKRH